MTNQLKAAWQTLIPVGDLKHGPLPPLMILLTVTTGVVDAFSYLVLGHVFVANMTGNVVFLAFSLAGAPGFTAWASILAIVAFAVGAIIGGRVTRIRSAQRGRIVVAGMSTQAVFVGAAFVVSLALGTSSDVAKVALISLLGIGMGTQNAVARSLGVPDLTTTVLTLTITGIGADSRLAGGTDSKIGRRLLSVLSMFGGALVGALLSGQGGGSYTILLAFALLAAVVVAAVPASRSTAEWAAARP